MPMREFGDAEGQEGRLAFPSMMALVRRLVHKLLDLEERRDGTSVQMASHDQPSEQPRRETEDREPGQPKPGFMQKGVPLLPQMRDVLGTVRERSFEGGPQPPSRIPRRSEQNDG
jgi:hypothetical protein